jgi:hypothetical protein
MRQALILFLLTAAGQAQAPALIPVDGGCAKYAASHVLVRTDVWDRVDASDRKLELCEPALTAAQADLKKLSAHDDELKRAVDELQAQKRVLTDHVARLEGVIAQQKALCGIAPRVSAVAEDVWEWVDAPLSFAAGAGMCVGIAFALNEVSR